MLRHDGGTEESDRPVINLVRFDTVEPDLADSLVVSLEGFFRFIGEDEFARPEVRQSRRCLPAKLPDNYQGSFLLNILDNVAGNIVIGITDAVFSDPNLPRKVFGYGSGGRAVISTYRFRRESSNRRLLYERLDKEIVKILALACDLPVCSNPLCIVIYHKSMVDIDRNTTVCPSCRAQFVRSLGSYLGGKTHE